MYFHEKMHESLPLLCFAMGLIFVIGAAYIGIGHGFTVGYAMLGVTCMVAGVYMAGIRRKVRTSEIRSRH